MKIGKLNAVKDGQEVNIQGVSQTPIRPMRAQVANVSYPDGKPYVLPPATKGTLGGVIVGDDLTVTEEGRISVDKTDTFAEDNTKPITAAAVYTQIGNINALLATI